MMPNNQEVSSDLIFSMTCSEKQVVTLLGGSGGTPGAGGGNTVTFADLEPKRRERKQADCCLPSFQVVGGFNQKRDWWKLTNHWQGMK